MRWWNCLFPAEDWALGKFAGESVVGTGAEGAVGMYQLEELDMLPEDVGMDMFAHLWPYVRQDYTDGGCALWGCAPCCTSRVLPEISGPSTYPSQLPASPSQLPVDPVDHRERQACMFEGQPLSPQREHPTFSSTILIPIAAYRKHTSRTIDPAVCCRQFTSGKLDSPLLQQDNAVRKA